jgi:hypothetical protein
LAGAFWAGVPFAGGCPFGGAVFFPASGDDFDAEADLFPSVPFDPPPGDGEALRMARDRSSFVIALRPEIPSFRANSSRSFFGFAVRSSDLIGDSFSLFSLAG